jgi:hypothetical protein
VADTQDLNIRKEIVFPYSAFDLYASWPIYDNPVPYFPIRRTEGSNSLAILGRAFFQEAHLTANFENKTFIIGQAVSPSDGKQTIISIPKAGDEATPSKLAPGTIAGIVLGIILFLILVGASAFWFFFWRHRNRHSTRNDSKTPSPPTESTIDPAEKHNRDTMDSTISSTAATEMDGSSNPRQHVRGPSEISGQSHGSSGGGFGMGAIAEAEGDEGVHRFELDEGKDDTEAWAVNQARVQRGTFELEGETPLGWVRPRTMSGGGGYTPRGVGSARTTPTMTTPTSTTPRMSAVGSGGSPRTGSGDGGYTPSGIDSARTTPTMSAVSSGDSPRAGRASIKRRPVPSAMMPSVDPPGEAAGSSERTIEPDDHPVPLEQTGNEDSGRLVETRYGVARI